MSFEVGTRCWYPNDELGWIGGEITKNSQSDGKYHLDLLLENGETVTIITDSLQPSSGDISNDENTTLPLLRNPPILESTEDLTSLSYLNEPAILHAIKQRYAQLNIYTYSGIVLIATNPFDRVDQLYSPEMIQAYAGKRKGEMEPHLFAIAEDAYRLMKNDQKNQTIVVSGESGAGKTVSAKYIMRYFASVEEENSVQLDDHKHQAEMSETEEKILATNPIMEAFGNAKTTRNDNSSRFGKYLEILFDKNTSIIGARMRTYLLERSRLVYQPTTERNYHIFYQILEGLPQETKDSLHLTNASDFFYMNQGGETQIEGVDDAKDYKITVDALTLVGINPDVQQELFKILASLLHIGNIQVKKTRNDASLSSDEPSLQIACELLGIDSFNFAKWITKKQITTRSEKIISNLNYAQAIVAKDSVAKFIYSALFDWLVENINTVLCNPRVTDQINSFIGVLDIYGFEHFEKNSFEQFCINYANEKLQQEFNQHVFKLEQDEYIKEDINWAFIEFNDNQPCIDLIENKIGILSLLDEESRLPAGSDESWTQKLYQTLDKAPTNKVFSKPRFGQTKFVISHYALDVAYDVEGFIEKNRDTVSDGHLEVLKATTNETLQNILESLEKAAERVEESKKAKLEASKSKVAVPTRSVQKKPTLGSMFKVSLIELMETINSTNVHYIRCIKPNGEKEAWKFDNLMVLSQLRACGVLETIRISCAGFPSRWTFNEFILRYYILISPSEWSKIFQLNATEDDITDLCKKILEVTVKDEEKYQIGKTKIFFKAGMLAYLEKLRSNKMHQSIVLIQKKIRAKYYRNEYLAIKKSLALLNAFAKSLATRKRLEKEFKTRTILTVQSIYRAKKARLHYYAILNSIINIQSKLRQQLAKKELFAKRELEAAILIESAVRTYKPKKAYKEFKRGTVVVQSLIRRRAAQRLLTTKKADLKSVNHLQEVSYKLENKVVELTENLAMKVKENRDLIEKIKNLQTSLSKSDSLKQLLETQKVEHATALEAQGTEYEQKVASVQKNLILAKQEVESSRKELDSMLAQHQSLKEEVKKQLEELNTTKQLLSESNTEKTDLQDQVKAMKEEITRLQSDLHSGNFVFGGAQTPTRSNKRLSSYAGSMAEVTSPSDAHFLNRNSVNGVSNINEESATTSNTLSMINEELFKLLDDTKDLSKEIVEGLLKGFKIPETGVAIKLSEKDVLYPSRILIIVLSDMWRLGMTKQSDLFLADVLSTIQDVVKNLKGSNLIPGGAFWLTNVRELYSFVLFAQESIANDESYNKDLNDEEYREYLGMVNDLREDFEALSYNIYNLWLKRLQKDLSKKALQAVVHSESLPGFKNENSSFLPKIFGNNTEFSMDHILTFFNNIYWCMKSYHVENDVFRETVISLLKYVDAICFNDLIIRRGFLSWKRGLQLNYNVTRLEEWCKAHHIPEGADCLCHLVQLSKLLQLRKQSIPDIVILCEICADLKLVQIQKLISLYTVADYEQPISEEILSYVAEKIKSEGAASADGKPKIHSDDIFLSVNGGPFEDPFGQVDSRKFGKIEAYIPAWLTLPTTRRIVELVTQQVTAQDEEQAEN